MFRFIVFITAPVVEAARIAQSIKEDFLHSVDAVQLSNVSDHVCSSNPEPKDYYFDLPGGTVDNSAAVRLIRNPSDPWIEVSTGAVWNVKADVDGNGNVIQSSILFEGRDKNDRQQRPQQYNLKSDLLYIKKRVQNGVMWVEVKWKGCGGGNGPLRPGRPTGLVRPPAGKQDTDTRLENTGPGSRKGRGKAARGPRGTQRSRDDSSGKGKGRKGGSKRGGRRGSRVSLMEEALHSVYDDEIALVEVYEHGEENSASSDDAQYEIDDTEFYEQSEDDTDEEQELIDGAPSFIDLSMDAEDRTDTAKGKAKGRGSKESRGGKSKGTGRKGGGKGTGRLPRAAPGPGPMRPSRRTGNEDCKPLTFAHGTFYPHKAVKDALQQEFQKDRAIQKGGWIVPSQTVKNVSIAPSLGKGIFGVLGFGTLGALAVVPVVWVGHEGGLAAGPIGALAGAVGSGAVAAYRSWKSRPKTASEKLYEKMYCLTKVKTCNGEACFKQCHDADGNEVIVPTHSEPGDGIRC